MESIEGKADHLVVLIHGLWGNPTHLRYLATALREAYNEDQIHILVAKTNADSFTYDGIELGGERTTHEIEAEIKKIEAKGTTLKKISIIGYSMGGLVARYAIGLLYASGLFNRIEPVNFTTFATPHLGVRTPVKGAASQLWNGLGARTLSTSGRQMFLIDNFRDTGRPLISVLADPNSIFIRALSQFKYRTLYANIINDRSVVYYTAAIDKTDPYADLTSVELNPIPDTQDIILDPDHPVRKKTPVKSPFFQRFSEGTVSTVKSIPYFFFLTVLLPIGTVFFLTNAGIQSFKSARRIQQHETGKTDVVVEKYRKAPFLIDEIRNAADRVYRHAAASGGEEYLPTPPPEEQERQNLLGGERSSAETLVGDGAKSDDQALAKNDELAADDVKFPTLALTKEQFDMIESLDNVGFTKYRVNITSVRHTHAAIIVRIPWRPGFDQGKVVVKHWTDHFIL